MQQAKKTFVLRERGGDVGKDWFVEYYHDGKRQRKYGTINQAETAEARREAGHQLIRQLQKSVKPDPANAVHRRKLYAALEGKENHLRKKSYQSYRGKLNGLFDFLGNRAVTNETLRAYFAHISNRLAAGTVHDSYFTLKRILEYEELGHLMKGIHAPSFQATPLRYYQRHQADRIGDYLSAHDPTLLLWCEFVYYCFLRPRSELRMLKVQDIYFDNREIIVPGSISKNKKTEPITIPDVFYPSIAHFQDEKPGRYIFEGKKPGTPTGYNTLGQRYHNVLQLLGFDTDQYSVYSWKHTGAVEFYRATRDLVGLQAQLRHHSLDQVKQYLRQLQVSDFPTIRQEFPAMRRREAA